MLDAVSENLASPSFVSPLETEIKAKLAEISQIITKINDPNSTEPNLDNLYDNRFDELEQLYIKDMGLALTDIQDHYRIGSLIDTHTTLHNQNFDPENTDDILLLATAHQIVQNGNPNVQGRYRLNDAYRYVKKTFKDKYSQLLYDPTAIQAEPVDHVPLDTRVQLIKKMKRIDHNLNMMCRYRKIVPNEQVTSLQTELADMQMLISSLDYFNSSKEQTFFTLLEQHFDETVTMFFSSLPDSPYFRMTAQDIQGDIGVDDINKTVNTITIEGLENGHGAYLNLTDDSLKKLLTNTFVPSRFFYGIHSIRFRPLSESPIVEVSSDGSKSAGQFVADYDKNGYIQGCNIDIFVSKEFSGDTDNIVDTIIHEIGHNSHALLSLEEIEAWRKVTRKEPGKKHRVSEYVHENKINGSIDQFNVEDWAETFEAVLSNFVSNNINLFETAPQRFRFMIDLIMPHLDSIRQNKLQRRLELFQTI